MPRSRTLFLASSSAALVLLAACAAPPRPPHRHAHKTHRPRIINPLTEPRMLARETCEPAAAVEQSFLWSGRGLEWRLNPLTNTAVEASLELYRPAELAGRVEEMAMTFDLHPPGSAGHLALALGGGGPNPTLLAHRAATLDAYRAGTLLGWEIISIPLTEFQAETGAAEGGPAPSAPDPWTAIRALHLRFLGTEELAEGIALRSIRFRAHPPPR